MQFGRTIAEDEVSRGVSPADWIKTVRTKKVNIRTQHRHLPTLTGVSVENVSFHDAGNYKITLTYDEVVVSSQSGCLSRD